MINLMINCMGKSTVRPRGEGTQNNFELGDSAPRSSPLPFYLPLFTERCPFCITSIDK